MNALPSCMRCGLGYDIHRLVTDGHPTAGIVLAGVRIPCPLRILAHSDGDAVLHALVDAILGAVGAGDIGEMFPDNDPRHRDRDSREFLSEVLDLPVLHDWRVINCDINVILQQPRLDSHKAVMRASLQRLLSLGPDAVGVKARTKEGCDAVGRGEALEAQALVLLARP